jgi:branched-chain amino acid aminotransferase
MNDQRSILVYVNGKLLPKEDASVSVYDSGFLYGDGVFEGIRAYNGRIFKLDEHIDRLFDSAHALQIEIRMSKDQVKEAVLKTVRANKLTDAHIKPIVSRGRKVKSGLDPRLAKSGTTFVIIAEPKDPTLSKAGVRVIASSYRRNPPECLDAKVKCCNYLNNILAKLEAIRAGVDDALMLDTHGFVAELSGTNIFIAKKGKLLTPYPYSCLNGITRATVIDLARQNGIDTSESNITLAEVYTADECFATGTAAEIAPVVEVNGRTIGDGNKGPITSRITEWFAALVTTTGTQI